VLEDLAGDQEVAAPLEGGVGRDDIKAQLLMQVGVRVAEYLDEANGVFSPVAQSQSHQVLPDQELGQGRTDAEELGREQVDDRPRARRRPASSTLGALALRFAERHRARRATDVALKDERPVIAPADRDQTGEADQD
jgi:hypothetical protein